MKMFFNLLVGGENSLEEKFQKAMNENPNLSLSIVQGFGQVLMLALRTDKEDNLTIEGFKAGKIPEEEKEKKIDNK